MRLRIIHLFPDASTLIISRYVFIIISLPKFKEDNPWIRMVRRDLPPGKGPSPGFPSPGIVLPRPRLNSSPFFVSRSSRGWHSSPSPDLPTYHGFLSARSSVVYSPGKIGFSMSSQEISFAFVLSMGTLFSRFSFRRQVFSLSFIIF